LVEQFEGIWLTRFRILQFPKQCCVDLHRTNRLVQNNLV
jgi:hypothetical protein